MIARRLWAWPLVPLYAAGLAVKDALRAAGVLPVRRLTWPVVSVGSLSAGGAGKTPVVIALAELLQARGWGVDVLSRGYGRLGEGVERVDPGAANAAMQFGDEPVLIARRTGSAVWVGASRFAAGMAAEGEADSSAALRNDSSNKVHLLDDGFQHRGLGRAMDVVLVTEEDLQDALLPAGNRRESLRALRRADVVVLREEERESIVPRLQSYIRRDTLVWNTRREISFPENLPVLNTNIPTYGHVVFSAIARPENFVRMLGDLGVSALEVVTFADHHPYSEGDMDRLLDIFETFVGNGFVTTEKDAVKLTAQMRARLEAVGPLCVARLEAVFVDEESVVRGVESKIGEARLG